MRSPGLNGPKNGYGGRVEYDLKSGGRFLHRASAEMKAMGMPDEMVVGQVLESDPPRRLVQTCILSSIRPARQNRRRGLPIRSTRA